MRDGSSDPPYRAARSRALLGSASPEVGAAAVMTEALESGAIGAAADPSSGPGASLVFDGEIDEPESASPRNAPLAAGRLAELSVRNLALIERLAISFEPGLNVLTGETGAGKSLLIDALGLAIGARSDTSLVRHWSDQARVEALFDRLPEPLICVREVSAAGRSTARVDDEAVTAASSSTLAVERPAAE